MPTILQLRRGTAAQNAAYTGSVGELTVDTENTILRLHDGSTAGGTAVGSSGITPTFGNVKIGVTAAGEIDTSSGNLTIDSAGGTVTIDDDVTISGSLTVSGTTTTVNSTQVNIQNAFVFEGATADDHETTLTTIDPTADRTIKLPNVSGTIPVLAAESSTQITATPAELNILDGVTATATEINLIDGGTTPGTTAVAGGDGLITNDNGTMQQTTVDTFDTYFAATTKTLTNKTLTSPVINTSVSGSAIKDEDDMSSNSATALATQQSIKAYVDTQLTAEDLDFQADSGGALSIDLDSETMTFTGGTGIDTSGSGNTVTFAIDSTVATLTGSQTLTNKTIALGSNTVSGTTSQFNSALSDGSFATLAGTETLTNKTINASQLVDSSVANAKLANSTITAAGNTGSNAIDLGDTLTISGASSTAAATQAEPIRTSQSGDTLTLTARKASTTVIGMASFAAADFGVTSGAVTIKNGGVSNDQLAGSIANGKLVNSTITVTDGSTPSNIALGGTLTFAAGEGLDVAQAGGTVTFSGEDASTTNKGVASFSATERRREFACQHAFAIHISNLLSAGSARNRSAVSPPVTPTSRARKSKTGNSRDRLKSCPSEGCAASQR